MTADAHFSCLGLSRNLFRGCVQLSLWPLFRPSLWRMSVNNISPELSPGFAWLDVSWKLFQDRRMRRLALQTCCLTSKAIEERLRD
jgi:hypothetical protein